MFSSLLPLAISINRFGIKSIEGGKQLLCDSWHCLNHLRASWKFSLQAASAAIGLVLTNFAATLSA
jgi:hypothetical protein